jgi:ABC-type Fe3+-hydroxamate transport system substrate-binding protein
MAAFTDQTGATIELPNLPQRIISVVPSQTELLHYLGLSSNVVGITKFCIHPGEWFRSKQRVGGTKQLNMDIIGRLQPDLIIANKEENTKEQIEALQQQYRVWISDINNLENAYQMIEQVGRLTGREQQALTLINSSRENFLSVKSPPHRFRTAYLIWQNPYMTTGGDTFIHAMLEAAGLENIFAHTKRYPELTIESLKNKKPELLLLSSEPFPFKQKHIGELQQQLPGTQIILVDGEMFSWYGSRLLKAPAYFETLLNEIKDISGPIKAPLTGT